MFIMGDRELTKKLVRRAEAAGFKAIVLTVDYPRAGWRRADQRHHLEWPDGFRWENLVEEIEASLGKDGHKDHWSGCTLFNMKVTWEDIKWLKSFARVPVILKGILSPADALIAVECGVDGIIVSTHGGRHMDSIPASVRLSDQFLELD